MRPGIPGAQGHGAMQASANPAPKRSWLKDFSLNLNSSTLS